MNVFTLPKLNYAYDAMVPYIDEATMEIHYTKHHQGYVNKLNAALKEEEPTYPEDVVKLLFEIDKYSTATRNNAGGHYNHTLFWESLAAEGKKEPKGSLGNAIRRGFGDLPNFQKKFTEEAMKLFGSGWTWLCVDRQGNLVITTTPNQDNPLMPYYRSGTPILGLDVWEHAYYLKYQNRRAEYIASFWHIIDWQVIEDRYVATL